MDKPKADMTKEQRLALIDYEKRVADAAEAAEKQRRALETERKVGRLQ